MVPEAERHAQALAAGMVLYRSLLHLYPHAFWQTYNEEMEADFEEMSRDALATRGRMGLASGWLVAAADLSVSIVREWIRTPWLLILPLASIIACLVFYGTMGRFWRAVARDRVRHPESPELFLLMALMVLVPVAATVVIWCAVRFVQARSIGPRRRA